MTSEVANAFYPLRDKVRTIVINDQFRLAPWADVLYGADWQWWMHPNNRDALDFVGTKVTVGWPVSFPQVMYLNAGHTTGLDSRADHLATCNNSGHQAMDLAVHFGATTLLLFGFDMRKVDGKAHNFGDHPKGLENNSPFKDFVRLMTLSAPAFYGKRVEVINCTPRSALKCFKHDSLENVIARITSNT